MLPSLFWTQKHYWQCRILFELAQWEETLTDSSKLKWTHPTRTVSSNWQPHQPSCGTLAPLVEPQLGHHGGQTGSPHSRHKQRLMAELLHTKRTSINLGINNFHNLWFWSQYNKVPARTQWRLQIICQNRKLNQGNTAQKKNKSDI